jgi:mRNA interferase RelE/StbE
MATFNEYIQRKGQPSNFYRIRVGGWRIIYTIHDDVLLVVIVDVGPRGSIYRDW